MVCTVLVIVFKILTEKKNIPLYVTTDAWKEQQASDLEAAKNPKKKKKEEKLAPSILSADSADVTLNDGSSAEDSANPEEAPTGEESGESAEETAEDSDDAAGEADENTETTDESEEQ